MFEQETYRMVPLRICIICHGCQNFLPSIPCSNERQGSHPILKKKTVGRKKLSQPNRILNARKIQKNMKEYKTRIRSVKKGQIFGGPF